jgi:hypothetical protein
MGIGRSSERVEQRLELFGEYIIRENLVSRKLLPSLIEAPPRIYS